MDRIRSIGVTAFMSTARSVSQRDIPWGVINPMRRIPFQCLAVARQTMAVLFGVLVLLVNTVQLAAQSERTELTLDQVVEIALQRNPGIMSSEQQVEAAKARVTQNSAAYWPQVTSTTSYQRQRTALVTGTTSDINTSKEYDLYNTNLSASQYIYDFGQTSGLVEESRQNLGASRHGWTTALADVVQQTKRAYYEVLKNQHLVQVAEETLDSRKKHLEQATAFYQVGLRPKIDMVRAEVDVASAKQSLIQTRYNENVAYVNLNTLLGGPPVAGPYRVRDETGRAARPKELEPLVDMALKARSEILQLEAQIRANDAHLHSVRGKFLPSVAGSATYGWEDTQFPLDDYWQVGAKMTWSIFSGFQTQGEVAETKAKLKQTRAQLEQMRLQVTQQVSQAFLVLDAAEQSIETSVVTVRQAQENLDLAEGRYRTGVGDAIEYTDAQVSLTSAKNTLVQANYIYLQALVDLDRALGRGPKPPETPQTRHSSWMGR
jgi:outer membrane protein